ncbi:LOW QUALITY PROTEIN: autophagy-related protein 2 homolog A [Drosophila busckii]|uniref:LOW QUALITY PROTEIN: autophagy-related protein 2 homolog A n=1 Tax=Drosophila busckii TaxID=30019 RepID=UPI00143327D2|nr:LOW QUALITY PROTEIN: autophagy-related protein 2 homolog A [Drosophila busckii]
MSWFNLWDGLKTKTCRYLLQRYLGQFFENNLNLEQLKVDLYNGKAVVENISLKVNALNELFEEQGWAFEVVSGHIGCLTAMVPWNALMTNDSSLCISDLTITLRPVTRCQSQTTMLESMWSSVSSSMQMAEECMKQVDDDIPFLNHNNTLIGLEKFAETIDNVLNRIHAELTNTTLNIEYALPGTSKKLIVSLKAHHIEYKNQTGFAKYTSTTNEVSKHFSENDNQTLTSLPMIARHNIVTNDLTIYTSEVIHQNMHYEHFVYSGQLCKIVKFKGCQNFQISVKQTENVIGPKINLEVVIDDICFMLTPRQVHHLVRMTKGFNKECPKVSFNRKYSDINYVLTSAPKNTKMAGIIENNGEWCTDSVMLNKQESMYTDKKTKICESVISSTSTSFSNSQTNAGVAEKSGEILKFKIQVYKIIGLFLHNDILLPDTSQTTSHNSLFTNESFTNYSITADNFFSSTRNNSCKDSSHLPIKNTNYLLFRVSSIFVNGNQQRFCSELTLKTTSSATMVDISEIINNIEYYLILFDRKKNCQDGYHTRPELVLSHSSKNVFKPNCNRSSNQMECTLDDCTIDLDITIYDRISAILGVSPFTDHGCKDIILESSNPTEMQIKCSLLKMHLRFPVVDGRLPQDPNKIPWWEKSVRIDYLSLDLRNISVLWNSNLTIDIDELDVYYMEDDYKNGTHLLNCVGVNNLDCNDRIRINVSQVETTTKHLRLHNESAKNRRNSPFSSNQFGFSSHLDDNTEKGDVFLPGETDEINEFCESCKNSSNLKIGISVPKIKLTLESKDLYEIIYNRLNGDLLMWEPHSPLYQNYETNHQQNNVKYKMGWSGDEVFHSFNTKSEPSEKSNLVETKSVFSLELCIAEGSFIIFTNVLESDKIVQPIHYGKLQINLKGFKLFTVTAPNNDKNISYFLIQLREIDVYHIGQTLENVTAAWDGTVDEGLTRIISNCLKKNSLSSRRQEVLCVVAEIKKQPEKRLKRMKLAIGLNGAVLWHYPASASHNWINQLIDFLNVADFPIEEYEPFALVSEIQAHFWNLSIDYRPKYLPFRTYIDIGYCTLSSNIVCSMSGCTLRVMSEDCILSIGPVAKCAKDSSNHSECGILVPVLNIGLLNVSLRINEQSKTSPSIDLRSSIHDVHLKTCFDSADALAQIISYIANDKDIINTDKTTSEAEKTMNSTVPITNQNNDQTSQHINNLMADAVKDMYTNISSSSASVAFSESKMDQTHVDEQHKNLTDISYDCTNFDFESNIMLQSFYQPKTTENSLPQINEELGSIFNVQTLEEKVEKDFHIIRDDELYFMDQFGVQKIFISEDPLRIVDDHFCLPNNRADVLRPPEHFPVTEQSYTLCEMTFTWHLFGGKDFPDHDYSTRSTSYVNISKISGMSETYKQGVSEPQNKSEKRFDKETCNESQISMRNSEVLVEIQLSKIRFSHDIYPTNSNYSSRQVLIISDIEIRDRLVSSDINKLLYHPSKNIMQQRTYENMVTVKSVNARTDIPKNWAEECSLKVSILPIRLNIDQDTLKFLEEFFTALVKRSTTVESTINPNFDTNASDRDVPIMSVNEISVDELSQALQNFGLDTNEDEYTASSENISTKSKDNVEDFSQSNCSPIYFKEFIFSPALPICFDYHGRRIELSRGPITGLLMGLAQLQGSGICLREVVNRRGLLGWGKLIEFLSKEWLKDIKRNQLPNILSGIGPTNAVLQLFQGIFDLFRLPIQQYNKDGRIIRGFQLGAQSFSARTAFAALEITSRIIHLLQFTAETTFDMLSAGPSPRKKRKSKHGKKRKCRPKNLREGVENAYLIVKEGINESANTLMEAAIVEHDQKGYSGAVGAVVRQLPQLVVCPAVLATQATTNILGGAKSSLVPEAKLEARDKWKPGFN